VHLRVVLACTLAVSLIWTIGNLVILSTARIPVDFGPINYPAVAARWVIGNYLGVLTIVPLVLLIREGKAKQFESWRSSLGRAVRSPLAIEAATCVLPALVLLTWLARETSSESMRGMVQMSMFAPVLWFALRRGWHGAALGGAGASIAVAVTMPQLYDPATLQSEALVAFAVSSMLLFGSRMAVPHRQVASDGRDSGNSLDLARRIQAQCEIQLQQSALGIDRASETVHAAENLLFDRSPSRPSAVDVRELRRLATATQEQLFQLADSLNPVSLREQGLEAALRQGGIARALDTHRIRYWCQLRSSVDCLSPTLQLSIYRLVCEGVSYLCAQHPVGCLTVRVRHAMRRGRHLVFVQISAQFFGNSGALLRAPSTLQRRLSVTGRGIDAIKDRAALHEGVVRMRGSDRGACIRVLLLDPAARQPERVAPVPHATPVILAPS
jgi:glucose-6-phosphate-specific signal transduction histidine kinase